MSNIVASLTATEDVGDTLISFGSGTGSRNAGARSQGRGGRKVAPAGATRSLLGAVRREAERSSGNRTARSRRARALAAEAIAAAQRGRGGPRLTNAQIADFRRRLRALGTAINS